MITESNEDINSLVRHLDKLIIEFRSKHPKSLILVEIRRLYVEEIMPWLEEFMLNDIEPTDAEDEIIKNQILDLILYLKKIL